MLRGTAIVFRPDEIIESPMARSDPVEPAGTLQELTWSNCPSGPCGVVLWVHVKASSEAEMPLSVS